MPIDVRGVKVVIMQIGMGEVITMVMNAALVPLVTPLEC